MNILVPLNNKEDIARYMDAGAKEYYMGFYDEEFAKRFGKYACINRLTGFLKDANKNSFSQMLELVKKIKKKQGKAFVTFNAGIYATEEMNYLEPYFLPLKEAGIDGIIVSNLEMVVRANRYNLPVVLSTIAGVYNHDIAEFYESYGIKRMILPRDLSLKEMESIVDACPDMEFEVFLMRNGCKYSDGNCLGFHRKEKCSLCAAIGESIAKLYLKEESFPLRHDGELTDMLYHQLFHKQACGICALYDMLKMGIHAGKIVGRSDDSDNIARDIKLACANIAIAKNCKTKEEYLERMLFPEFRAYMCKEAMNCYYGEVRF